MQRFKAQELVKVGFTRRSLLKASATLGLTSLAPPVLSSGLESSIKAGLRTSDLVYLSPLKTNGKVSSCQAEIWFAFDGVDIFVCTGSESWRAQAPRIGLTTTQFWVGDLGQWKKTDGKYQSLPSLLAKASIEADEKEQERALELFGDKYRLSWLVWGPRFRKGLKNGKRTMLRYRPIV